ncbi:hypothetical protein Natpe_4031 (plasmid) [Natrinema pellirubrum DSM 15624]|uniref:Uncharacterized protein n=1 Tax=Natrinema pellirubrum (strain DSM 15624 / CIP 106293 / JCM 10476 / NCIMB 786 / 157) TaxID=797303 RepID=L0JR82_NATP1|nr:hypothetical protein Natpe_4031 [Natrinema pellirubrum DSM 15624]
MLTIEQEIRITNIEWYNLADSLFLSEFKDSTGEGENQRY